MLLRSEEFNISSEDYSHEGDQWKNRELLSDLAGSGDPRWFIGDVEAVRLRIAALLLDSGFWLGHKHPSAASERGRVGLVKLFIDRGAPVNPEHQSSENMRSALDVALMARHTDIVRILREAGAMETYEAGAIHTDVAVCGSV